MNQMLSDVPYALVVDDDDVVMTLACAILEDAGFRTVKAPNGDAALELLKGYQEAIVVLFTDVQMPGQLNGFALARETARLWPHISILVASAAISPSAGDMPEGACFIAKPFSAEVVEERLNEILADGQKPEPLKNKV